jgi:DNA polymerase-3 subunit epsilon
MGKILWLDTETTGLDAFRSDIIQIGYIVEVDGQPMEEGEILMAPSPDSVVSPEALTKNKFSAKDLSSFQSQTEGMFKFEQMLQRHVDRYISRDKFVLAGYNVGFDDKFLRAAFKRNKNIYYGSYIMWAKLDVQSFVAQYLAESETITLSDQKLETVCRHFHLEFEAHDALEDIKATRKLYKTLQEVLHHA